MEADQSGHAIHLPDSIEDCFFDEVPVTSYIVEMLLCEVWRRHRV
jgi:hypothetical protein